MFRNENILKYFFFVNLFFEQNKIFENFSLKKKIIHLKFFLMKQQNSFKNFSFKLNV